MKTKTIGKILIILIVVILILGGIFAYLYFGTDLLKSNEQLFFKYLGQLVDSENGFIDSKLTEYTNKKMTGKYEDSGQFSVNIDVTDVNEDMLATVNDFNVTYSGKVDNTARKNEQEISINYSDDVNFPVKYKYANETLGLQTEYVSAKYIGIENNNLKEFVEKFGITNTESIPDTIEFFTNDASQTITFTDEEEEQLKNTYQSVISGRLEGKEFTKAEDGDTTNYSVEMTNQEFMDIINAFLETLKNDQILLPKLEQSFKGYLDLVNQSSSEEITIQSIIQDMIDDLSSADVQEQNLVLTVSQTNRTLTGITISGAGDEAKLTKTNNQDTLSYRIEVTSSDEESQDSETIYFNASYQGLEQLSSVNENYEIGVNTITDGEEQNSTYTFNYTDTFNDSVNIEDYGEDEIEILNEYDSEQLATLLQAIVQRISEANASQMEEIGFTEYGNPMLYAFPITSIGLMTYNQTSNVVDDEPNNEMNESSSMSDIEMQQFNQMFATYEGSQRGVTIKSLLQTVASNNISATDDSRKVEVTGDFTMSKDDTEAPLDSVDNSSTYNVQLEYTEGVVSKIIITQE